MAIIYSTTFTVEGSHSFPFDMLRYDRAFPASEPDSVGLVSSPGTRQVKLGTFHMNKLHACTPDRWASFGWKVVDVEAPVKM